MEWPDAWVVHVDLNDEMAAGDELLGIAALGIFRVDDGAVPFEARALGQNEHGVAVKMHWVGSGRLVCEDEADRRVAAEVVDVPLRVEGVRVVAGVVEEKRGVVVVGAECGAVHGPDEVAGAVDRGAN